MLGSTLPRREKDGATTTPGGLERLDRLVEKNRERLDAVCKARGVDFGRMTEEERERFVDHILGA
jgi:hypothetical protein